MPSVDYMTLDVFTDTPFAGNPLAVIPDARSLDTAQMQAIAREFGYSETTFVLPSGLPWADRKVRIFTPGAEIPFAGHPIVGTALALTRGGYLSWPDGRRKLALTVPAGRVDVQISEDAPEAAELTAPQTPSTGAIEPVETVAAALGLVPGEIDTTSHQAIEISAGLPFLAVRVTDLASLGRAAPKRDRWQALSVPAAQNGICAYTLLGHAGGNGQNVRVRVFVPEHGPDEDPATGSAAAALGGLLAGLDPRADGTFAFHIAQGVEMGRPSRIEAIVDKVRGHTEAVRVAGGAVLVMAGRITVPEAG